LFLCVVGISVYLILLFGDESHWRSIALVLLYLACRLLVERFGEEHQQDTWGRLFSFPCFMHILGLVSALLRSAHFDFLLNFWLLCGCLVADASLPFYALLISKKYVDLPDLLHQVVHITRWGSEGEEDCTKHRSHHVLTS
jgi:hypothetical protein